MLKQYPESAGNRNDKISVNVDEAWIRLKGRLEKDGLIRRKSLGILLSPGLQIAAAIVLVLGLSVIAYLAVSSSGNQLKLTAQSDATEIFGLSLPDGSLVDMNINTRIRYRSDGDGNRLVRLSGEAYFNVRHDLKKPFIINTGDAMVRVTGTSFSVRSDPANKRTEVYVESGSVRLYRADDDSGGILLEPGIVGIIENDRFRRDDNPDENYLSWKTKKLTFRQTKLGEVARVLNRTYKMEFLFDNEDLKNCLYTGTFDQAPVDTVVRVLEVTFGFDADRDKNSYVFHGEGCN